VTNQQQPAKVSARVAQRVKTTSLASGSCSYTVRALV